MASLFNGILYSSKNEWSASICNSRINLAKQYSAKEIRPKKKSTYCMIPLVNLMIWFHWLIPLVIDKRNIWGVPRFGSNGLFLIQVLLLFIYLFFYLSSNFKSLLSLWKTIKNTLKINTHFKIYIISIRNFKNSFFSSVYIA